MPGTTVSGGAWRVQSLDTLFFFFRVLARML